MSAVPESCKECQTLGTAWGCKNGDMPCPWIKEPDTHRKEPVMNETRAHIGVIKQLKTPGRAPGAPSVAEDDYFKKRDAELAAASKKPKKISVHLPEFGGKKYTIVYSDQGIFDHVHDQNKMVVMISLIQHGQDVDIEKITTLGFKGDMVRGVYVKIQGTNIVFPKRLFHLM